MKYGKDFAVIIPEELVKKLDLTPNTPIRIYEITAGTIAIEKVKLAPISQEEAELINKLLQIKFEERTPDKVNPSLSEQERKLVDQLLKKHLLNIYYDKKYSNGVYQIPNLVYRQLLEKSKQPVQQPVKGEVEAKREEKQPKKEKPEVREKKEEAKKELSDTDLLKKFNKEGFLVLASEADAKEISRLLSDKIERNKVTGIRGFDKKYYLVKNSFVLKFQSKVKSALKSGPKSTKEIAESLDIPEQAAIALLTVLREEGELIEKRKGIFALVD